MAKYEFKTNMSKENMNIIEETLRKGEINQLSNNLRIAIEKENYEEAEKIKRVLAKLGVESGALPIFDFSKEVCQCERAGTNWRYDYEYERNKCACCGLPWQTDC